MHEYEKCLLVFRCPLCTADLSRFIDGACERAIIRYRCPKKLGGCGEPFTITFERGVKFKTEPPQQFPNEPNEKTAAGVTQYLAE